MLTLQDYTGITSQIAHIHSKIEVNAYGTKLTHVSGENRNIAEAFWWNGFV